MPRAAARRSCAKGSPTRPRSSSWRNCKRAMADSEQRAQAGTATPAPQTVGQMLKQARTAHDLTLEQVSTELRIEAQNLGALEQDRFEKIGIPVFVKGYLRQYGG